MRAAGAVFLPQRLRPSAPRRRARRRLAVSALAPALALLALPLWRVGEVRLPTDLPCPEAVRQSLAALVGTPVPLLDLSWVRAQVEAWPGVATVGVAVQLPGTLVVTATRVAVAGSVPVGSGWHAVAADGTVAGRLAERRRPLLEGFPPRPDDLAVGLEVARRLERETGVRVDEVRRVTPADFRVVLRVEEGAPATVVSVLARATAAERFWCERLRDGDRPGAGADLRGEWRLVLARPAEPVEPAPHAADDGATRTEGPA